MRSGLRIYFWTAAAVLLLPVALTAAESKVVLAVTGDVPKPETYTLEQLHTLSVTNVTAREQGGTNAEYTGVAVGELLRRAGAPSGEGLRGAAALTKTVVVHAADGYQAVFSLAELDSAMTDHPALVVWSRNGAPLDAAQGPLRIVAPGDKRQARWVRKVTAIEVVPVKRPALTNAEAAVSVPAAESH